MASGSFSSHNMGLENLTVLVIEHRREMQRLLRGMLANYGMRNVRMYADSGRASQSVLADPPHLILLDWEAEPHNGAKILKLFRHQNMYPVCLVPIVVTVSEPRRRHVERALRLGAQAVVAKPLSPHTLVKRIDWVMDGNQQLRLVGDRYLVDGMVERLQSLQEQQAQLDNARAYQESQFAEMEAIQQDVDRLLSASF